ncbi:Fic family protein [Algoriphagus confluentis]|uniref:Fic family protein n=1 Tax=Algoriphagus confluentis TaxID=1697556 RepID=A0ABQ6PQC2_9BACT|nr:Fic family protein [Algoriphagus confluentis]
MMRIEDFVSGRYISGYQYRYFVPEKVNQEWIWTSPKINRLLERASIRLGELNSFARMVPNIDLFIQLHVAKEAVISSKIEGTQTRIEEALLPIESIDPERRDDWQEVNNYIQALNSAISELHTLPLSSRLLRNTHQLLMQGVRGENKQPGSFRQSQNWIGGNSLPTAVFVPPSHELVPDLMSDLEQFLHNQEIYVPSLIRIALAHYQFETIHPFLDGNGRVGRLLITLYLVSEGILDQPLLYLSMFFEKNRSLYYDQLSAVRSKNTLEEWVCYFLEGIEETASIGASTLSSVLDLKKRLEVQIEEGFGRRSAMGKKLLHGLFQEPTITVEKAAQITGLSFKAANDLVVLFREKGILEEQTGQARNRVFVFVDYLKAFEH